MQASRPPLSSLSPLRRSRIISVKMGLSFLCLGLIVVMALGLYQVKYRVMALEDQLHETHQQIAQEQQTLQVLQVEWHYLTNPQRLRDFSAAGQVSNQPLRQVIPTQVKDLSRLSSLASMASDKRPLSTLHLVRSLRAQEN